MNDQCEACWAFFAELRWYDYEDKTERIDRYLEERRREVDSEAGDGEHTCAYCGAPIDADEA